MKIKNISDSITITQKMIDEAPGFVHNLFSPVLKNRDGSSADGRTVYTASGSVEQKEYLQKGLNFIIRPLNENEDEKITLSHAENLATQLVGQRLTPTRVNFMAWDDEGQMTPVAYDEKHMLASCGFNPNAIVINDDNVVLFAFMLSDNILSSYRLWGIKNDDTEVSENSVNTQTQLYIRCVNIDADQTQDFHKVLRGNKIPATFKRTVAITTENAKPVTTGSNSDGENTTGLEEVGF